MARVLHNGLNTCFDLEFKKIIIPWQVVNEIFFFWNNDP